MKNAIKFTIIVLFGSLLAFIPKECNPHGEEERPPQKPKIYKPGDYAQAPINAIEIAIA